jgi:hypothetical protein
LVHAPGDRKPVSSGEMRFVRPCGYVTPPGWPRQWRAVSVTQMTMRVRIVFIGCYISGMVGRVGGERTIRPSGSFTWARGLSPARKKRTSVVEQEMFIG